MLTPEDAPSTSPGWLSRSLDRSWRLAASLAALVIIVALGAVTRFANPNGLDALGGNMFRQAANSGEPVTGVAGLGGRGVLRSGFLEESNVDFARQFTDLIIAQRAFQANARTITTADRLLEELVNVV